ncbi:hypothetical protein VKS41_003454 [Umbelopsis sp. WA50703]
MSFAGGVGASGPFDLCILIAIIFLVVWILCLTSVIHMSVPSTAYIFLVLAIVFFCVWVFFRFMRIPVAEDPITEGAMMPPAGGMPFGPQMSGVGPMPPGNNAIGPGAPPMMTPGAPMAGPAAMENPGMIPPQQPYGAGMGMQPGIQPGMQPGMQPALQAGMMGRPPVGGFGPGYV